MKGIVDRFEGEFVVIEIEGETQDIPRTQVDKNVQAGDVVELHDGIWVSNTSETEKRASEIKKLMESVWED